MKKILDIFQVHSIMCSNMVAFILTTHYPQVYLNLYKIN